MEYKIVIEYDKYECLTSGVCDDDEMSFKELDKELYRQAVKCVENHIKNDIINPDRNMVEKFKIYIDGAGLIYNIHAPAGVVAGMRKYSNKEKTIFRINFSSGIVKLFDDYSNINWLHVTKEEVLDRIADFINEAREEELPSPLPNIVYVLIDTYDDNRGMYISIKEWKKIKEKAAAAKWEKIKEKIAITKPTEKEATKNELANCKCGGKPYVEISRESNTIELEDGAKRTEYGNYVNIICPKCGAKYAYPIEKFRVLSPFDILEEEDKEKIIMNWNLMNGEFYYF